MPQDGRGGYHPSAPGTPDKRGPMNIPPNNLPYGRRKQAEQSLAAVPMAGSNPRPSPGPTPAPSPAPGGPPGLPISPTDIPNLSDPSAYPNEPLTAGLNSGPGVGPEALHLYAHGNEELSVLRGVYMKLPNEDLRKLIEWVEGNS